jgi:RNA polymerase sigma factor (sigma-70 family)
MKQHSNDIADLVTRAQQGDTRAFEAIMRRFEDMAVGYSAALIGDFHQAQDAAQEAFLDAFRLLPTLREPAAFASWFRLLVRKHCDRVTRRRSLEVAMTGDGEFALLSDPAAGEMRREARMAVRAAIASLPEGEREVVLLYYVGERSTGEIAAFLEVPVSTVKNRLLMGRKKLRERMGEMEDVLRGQKPSRDDGFRSRVFAELFAEYRRQQAKDPVTADRSLLARARETLLADMKEREMDAQCVHHGAQMLFQMWDWQAMCDLLRRYLAQRLSPSEEAWARHRYILGLASQYSRAVLEELVKAHGEFVGWVSEQAARGAIWLDRDTLLPVAEDSPKRMASACLPLWAVGTEAIANNYMGAGKFEQWRAMAMEVLSQAPKTGETRRARFGVWWSLVSQLGIMGLKAEALAAAEAIGKLAEEPPDGGDDAMKPRWRIEAAAGVICVENRTTNDAAAIRRAAEEAIGWMEAWEAGLAPGDAARKEVAAQRHNMAFLVRGSGQFDLAAALFGRVIADGHATAWTYLWQAGAVWYLRRDRAEVIELLRQGACRHQGNDFVEHFRRQEAFAEVVDDVEFLRAVTVG